ncbi:hemolysin family protein [soil metagenome]
MAPAGAGTRVGALGETHDGPSTAAPGALADPEAESPNRTNFLSRLFRRDKDEDSAGPAANGAARGPDRLQGAMPVNLEKLIGLRVEDVATPRADIVAVPIDAELASLVEVCRRSENTRLPVYGDSLDEPAGLVHLKDVALRFGFGAEGAGFDLRALIRPLIYAPPSMPVGALLRKMQTSRTHMALVIDEYGGVDGLVTLEDILEQVVGEIGDEHDAEQGRLWQSEAAGVYLVNARLDLEELEAETGVLLGVADFGDDVDTLGGLVAQLAGRVPVRGEVVSHPGGHEFEVVDADARRIKRLRVRLAGFGGYPSSVGRAAE